MTTIKVSTKDDDKVVLSCRMIGDVDSVGSLTGPNNEVAIAANPQTDIDRISQIFSEVFPEHNVTVILPKPSATTTDRSS